ncbi:transporter substrate-binding domain-containing protein, partial [Streptomyces sp. NPDC050698]
MFCTFRLRYPCIDSALGAVCSRLVQSSPAIPGATEESWAIVRRRFDRPRNARWPILAILLALIAALFAPGIASAQPGRTYTIATDLTFAPFEFENEDGKLVGIDIDLLNAIAEDQGFKVDIKQLGFDAALQAVQAGQADGVIAGMSITDARKQVFDFSDPYFESGVQMAVLETDNDVKSYEDLKGKRVAVKNGTEGASFAESIKDQYGFTTVYFADSASMYDEVHGTGCCGPAGRSGSCRNCWRPTPRNLPPAGTTS